MQLAEEICNRLSIDPSLVLKKKIRGLNGITACQLIDAIIQNDGLEKAGAYLGYTVNPIKQCVRSLLKPIFTEPRNSEWRRTLLEVVNNKFCSGCNSVLHNSNFYTNTSKRDGLSGLCKSCAILDSKKHKFYILERTPNWSELDLIAEFYKKCPKGFHVDHIIPLRGTLVSGLHVLSNLQYLSAQDNRIKKNTFQV